MVTEPTEASVWIVNRSAISRELGVDLGHISRVFNPNQPTWPSVGLSRRLAKYFDTDLETLWEYFIGLGKRPPKGWED